MTRKVKKGAALGAALLLGVLVFLLPVSAQSADTGLEAESEEIREEWEGFVSAIPPEVAELSPPDFFSKDMEAVGSSVGEASALGTVFRTVGRVTGVKLAENLALLARICGILVLSAVLGALTQHEKSGASAAVSLVAVLAIVGMVFAGNAARFREIECFFDTVRALCLSLIPLMGALYAMGGNVSAAVANHGVMSGFLTVLETVCSGVVVPVAGLCVALGLLDAVTGKGSLRSLSTLVKRTFTFGLSFLMMLLSFVLGLQQTLAKGTDTLALRTVRFAAGSFLPVVGGSVSESLRTVAGSVQYLRSAVGTGALLVVFFLFLPTFLSVLITRLAFLLGGAVAGLLGCPREERLLGELSGVWGYFLAIVACLFVMTVFSLTLFAHSAAAIGG